MSIALPKIDQAGRPAGTAGKSRDDLVLTIEGGPPIQLSDVGGDATTWLWQIVDQPPGANATLSSPTGQTTQLTNVSEYGSYLIQLSVDGGLVVGSVRRIIAAIQIPMPSWILTPYGTALRIPARGETFEFNAETTPGPAPASTRGWAQEMDHFFRAIANYGFGVLVQNNGVYVGTEPFYKLNFVSGGCVDAGNGTVDISGLQGPPGAPGAPGAPGPANFVFQAGPSVTTPDTGWTVVGTLIINPASYSFTQASIQYLAFASGGANAQLRLWNVTTGAQIGTTKTTANTTPTLLTENITLTAGANVYEVHLSSSSNGNNVGCAWAKLELT